MKSIKSFFAGSSELGRLGSSRLGKAPAFLWVLGYLLTILVFSVIYFALPWGQFYLFFTEDRQKVLYPPDPTVEALRAAMVQAYRMNGQANRVVNGWRMDTDNLGVSSLYTGSLPRSFQFTLVVPLKRIDKTTSQSETLVGGLVSVLAVPGQMYFADRTYYSEFMLGDPFTGVPEGVPVQLPNPGMQLVYNMVEPPADDSTPSATPGVGTVRQMGSVYVLPLPQDVYARVTSIGQRSPGALADVSAQYIRMLYFSAGVATSTGVGDILPASPLARLAVTSEVILALIFVLLFLNSIGYHVGERLANRPNTDKEGKGSIPIAVNQHQQDRRKAGDSQTATSHAESRSRKKLAPRQNRSQSKQR